MRLQKPPEKTTAPKAAVAQRLEDLPKLVGDFRSLRPMLDDLLRMHDYTFEQFTAKGRDKPDLYKLRCVFCFVATHCGGVSQFQISRLAQRERSSVAYRIKRCQIWMDGFPEFRAKVEAWMDFFRQKKS